MVNKQKFDNKGNIIKNKVKGYLSAKPEDKYLTKQSFKGELSDENIKFPKELGVKHPFSFESVEKIYKRVGIVNASVNKITDAIVGEFSIKTKKAKSKLIIDEFTRNTDFTTIIREWIREGLAKGNGFLEIDILEKKVRVLNANNMYVTRDKNGKIIKYTQWVDDINKFAKNSNKVITFTPDQIAHLRINKIAGEAYGIGLIWQNERVIENIILNEEDLHKLISRKAGAPLHVKVGMEGESVNPDDIDEFKNKLQYMTNSTEWVTDGSVKIDPINFQDIGKNLTETLNHDLQMFAFGVEIPLVLLGAGNIPEGLAKVQLESFQRRISSMQEEIESILEEHIITPLLKANNIDDTVEFVWNLPGEEEINDRLERLNKIVENPAISKPLRRMTELEIARLLNFEDATKYLLQPEKDVEEPIEPTPTPTTPPEKPTMPEENIKLTITEEAEDGEDNEIVNVNDLTVKEFVSLKETQKYSYSDYLVQALKQIRIDKFETLNIENLLLFKEILRDAFKENTTIIETINIMQEHIPIKEEIIKLELLRIANAAYKEAHKK